MNFHYDSKVAAKKAHNVDVFKETMDICRAGGYDTPNGPVALPPRAEVLAASRFYDDPPRVDDKPTVGVTAIDAVNADCIDVARDLVERGYNPILLNMANRHTPGGGVLNGARAQEESLFRQSDLCVSLYQYSDYHAGLLGLPKGGGAYPMDPNTGGIYSGRVTFFRTSQRAGDKLLETPFTCAVVSVAAINRPDLDAHGRLLPWAITATEKKIRTMLRIGLAHGHDAIVLGAWGCGAFHNPPEHMAEIFNAVLHEPEFENKFKVVRFAVIEDHNSRHSNYAPFDRQFNGGSEKTVTPSDNARTEVVFVLDRSGSMSGREQDVIGGFNRMIAEQRQKKGECLVSTVLFDDVSEVLHDRLPVGEIRPLTEAEYNVRGMTAYYDALGRGIIHHIRIQRGLPENRRAEKVLFVVMTDGCENASCEFSAQNLRRLIQEEQDKWGWEFVFIGAGIDAIKAAADIGISADRAIRTVSDRAGIAASWECASQAIANLRERRRMERNADGSSYRDEIDADFNGRSH